MSVDYFGLYLNRDMEKDVDVLSRIEGAPINFVRVWAIPRLMKQAAGWNWDVIVNLSPDWIGGDGRWDDFFSYASSIPLKANGKRQVIVVRLFDEPFYNKIKYKNQVSALKKLKKFLPNVKTVVTFAPNFVDNNKRIAPEYDIVSLTPSYGEWGAKKYYKKYKKLKKKIHAHQVVLMTLDCFQYRHDIKSASNVKFYDEKKARLAKKCYKMGLRDPKVIGLYAFTYYTFSDGYGIMTFPKLKKALIEIGRKITKSDS